MKKDKIYIRGIAMKTNEDGFIEFSDGIILEFHCIPSVLITSCRMSAKVRKHKKRVKLLRDYLVSEGKLS